jgi:hypothetical protein
MCNKLDEEMTEKINHVGKLSRQKARVRVEQNFAVKTMTHMLNFMKDYWVRKPAKQVLSFYFQFL